MVKKKEIDPETSLVDWVEESNQVGTPSMVLLPPRPYYFKVLRGQHKITIPRKGSYYDIDPEFFSKDDGKFNLLDEKNNAMFLPAISKVLFATKKYPNLDAHQLFAPIAIVFREDEVDILGQIIEMLNADEATAEDETIVKSSVGD